MILTPATAACALAAAYFAGSLPTGVLVARLRGLDITKAGSGNIGATNVARTLGKPLGILVLLIDAAKGFVPVFVARQWWLGDAQGPLVLASMGLLAILGHVFPVWLRFRGGKGVATGLGVFLALDPLTAAVALVLYVVVYATFRISSLGSLLAATSIPVTLLLQKAPLPIVGMAALVWLVIVARHRGNIRRLLRREESKV